MDAKIVLGLLLAALVFTFGCTTQEQKAVDAAMDKGSGEGAGEMEKPTGENDGAMDKGGSAGAIENESGLIEGSSTAAFYKPFTKSEYDAAKAGNKTIFLEFYANWCPICKNQEPDLEEAFASGQIPANVAGFRVNYDDPETDADEDALARQFNVLYQHTHVITNASGETLLKSGVQWSKEEVVANLSKFA